jgi:hypothetical protein
MRRNDEAVPEQALGLLPVTAAHLAAVPGVTEVARRTGADRGIDYLGDVEFAAMLHRHRRLLHRMNALGAWGGLLLAPGAVGAWFLVASTDWEDTDPVVGLVLFAPVVLLLTLSVFLLVRAFRLRHVWVRHGIREQVNGYLHVLSAAGFPSRELPAWLRPVTGRRWR